MMKEESNTFEQQQQEAAVETPLEEQQNDDDDDDDDDQDETKPLRWYKFEGVSTAQGYSLLGMGRGALVMSNIFLSTAFIYLANERAGCLDEEDEILDDCDGKAYGMSPASFVSNIAVISGLLSAFLMPVVGAMVDYTPHRRLIGQSVAVFMIVIQAVQIGTLQSTWFYMVLLQALAGFLYQVEVLSTYSYLPDIARTVGEEIMSTFASRFVMIQFGAQSTFLILVIALSTALGIASDDVVTAQMSQSLNVVWSGLALYFGWKLMPAAPASRVLPDNRNLVQAGFLQMYQTVKDINKRYAKGLRWFLLGVVFAEAAANAFTVVAVVYLDEHLGMTGTEIGLFFLITLIASLPGSLVATFVNARTNPNVSWRLAMLYLILVTVLGALAVDQAPKEASYLWGVAIGIGLGWFYPVENLFFSMCLPKGQEAELAGFFVYCTQILGWVPPLIFTGMVEADVSQTYGVMSVSVFFVVAIAAASMAAPWEEILQESGRSKALTPETPTEVVAAPLSQL